MTARDTVLALIRDALRAKPDDAVRQEAVAKRLARHPRGTIPFRVPRAREDCVRLLAEMLASQGAEVNHVRTPEAAARAIASYLTERDLPLTLRMGTDRVLAALPWKDAKIETRLGRADPEDKVSLSRAAVAAAETGTLFLVSGPDNPTTLNFLPETHMVLIRTEDVAGAYEEAWDRLRAIYGEGALPRTVNLISGPSRTADIEQTIVRGAHGPRHLHVLILG